MSESTSFITVHASVRPQRIVVLIDKTDQDWEATCLRIIEFFSRLWGGAYNIIVPTDGGVIDPQFWTILEAFDPDRVYRYQKTGEDLRLTRPEQYQRIVEADVTNWIAQFAQSGQANRSAITKQIDSQLRRASTSSFAVNSDLQDQIKIRTAAFWFQNYTVEAGAISALSGASYPLTDVTKIIANTQHADRFAAIRVPENSLPKLWFSSVCGSFDEKTESDLEALGVHRDSFDFEGDDLSQLMEFVVTGAIREPRILSSEKRNCFEFDGVAPFQLSMLQLGLYRSTKYPYWTEPYILVGGNTLEDFCLYYCLSRLRDRVAWVLPSITNRALRKSKGEVSRHELSFVAQLHSEELSQQSQGGIAVLSYSLPHEDLDAVIEQLDSILGRFRSPVQKRDDISDLIRFPLTAVERDNFQRDILVELSDDLSIGRFKTPKPKNFHTIHPYEHRYITQLSIAQESPPKHFDLGSWSIVDHNMTTHEVRVGRDGPAYFCPNVAYFGGDIDTVLVRPRLRFSPLHKLLTVLASTNGSDCRPSDKGLYAEETIRKWGGLAEVASFLRAEQTRALLDQFLNKSKSSGDSGVYLDSDRRRYLSFEAIKKHIGDDTVNVIDSLITKEILYRGFIFLCSYCRNTAWFSVAEITQEFRCKRCGRSQIYGHSNWKMPDEPAWHYKLDELVFQGYRQGMSVSLLALDHLRQRSESFSFATDREFWHAGASRPYAEADFFCVSDGILTIGEAKKEGRLGRNSSEEGAELAKYRRLAASLCARRLVLATFAESWHATTKERASAVFRELPYVRVSFLQATELLGAAGS